MVTICCIYQDRAVEHLNFLDGMRAHQGQRDTAVSRPRAANLHTAVQSDGFTGQILRGSCQDDDPVWGHTASFQNREGCRFFFHTSLIGYRMQLLYSSAVRISRRTGVSPQEHNDFVSM
jgi:hypothetical protein